MIPSRSLPYCGTGAAGACPLPLGADGGARRSVRSSALPHHGGEERAWQPSTRRGQPSAVQRCGRQADAHTGAALTGPLTVALPARRHRCGRRARAGGCTPHSPPNPQPDDLLLEAGRHHEGLFTLRATAYVSWRLAARSLLQGSLGIDSGWNPTGSSKQRSILHLVWSKFNQQYHCGR